MKIDLHVHSVFSPDSTISPQQLVQQAAVRGLDAVALTDHNTLKGIGEVRRVAGQLLIIPGCELSTAEGHLLCLGIDREIERGLPMQEAMKLVAQMGGVAIPSHPFRTGTGCGRKVLERIRPRVIEGMNGRNLDAKNRRAIRYAREHGLACTGGSDAHAPEELGRAFTLVEGEGLSVSEVLEAISSGRCTFGGNGQGIGGSMSTLKKIVGGYVKRGGHV